MSKRSVANIASSDAAEMQIRKIKYHPGEASSLFEKLWKFVR